MGGSGKGNDPIESGNATWAGVDAEGRKLKLNGFTFSTVLMPVMDAFVVGDEGPMKGSGRRCTAGSASSRPVAPGDRSNFPCCVGSTPSPSSVQSLGRFDTGRLIPTSGSASLSPSFLCEPFSDEERSLPRFPSVVDCEKPGRRVPTWVGWGLMLDSVAGRARLPGSVELLDSSEGTSFSLQGKPSLVRPNAL